MTQEDAKLVLKDLCARLPYGVRVFVSGDDFDNYQYPYLLTAVSKFGQDIFCKIYSPIYTPLGCPDIENVKPYLRSMSSMTEEEQRTLDSMCNGVEMVSRLSGLKMFDKAFVWLNENHFDYRGLIEKGLAIDATGLDVY